MPVAQTVNNRWLPLTEDGNAQLETLRPSDKLGPMPLHIPSEATFPAFIPPPRFSETSFASFRPQHPTQEIALAKVQAFVKDAAQPAKSTRRWPWGKKDISTGRGLYLDGGFGVGKTHLLAAAFHACNVPKKAYLSFQDLVYIVGAQGVAAAKKELGDIQFFCIDEFELDDPGNTLIVKSFLAHVFAQGGSVMTTSNTPPEAQGQGRFNADDFKREIQSVAERFTVVLLEGPDYRHRDRLASPLTDAELETRYHHEAALEPKELLTWAELLSLLTDVHPVRYGALMAQFGTLYVRGAKTLPNQNDALRFVHFVDKLYDLNKGLRLSGADELNGELENLFSADYRGSAYAKKHYRCLSRLSELIGTSLEVAPI